MEYIWCRANLRRDERQGCLDPPSAAVLLHACFLPLFKVALLETTLDERLRETTLSSWDVPLARRQNLRVPKWRVSLDTKGKAFFFSAYS